ncbi:BRISC and BRCA1-A complex member 2-like [Prorops nasuta]|uniref:BRISC and BRCA1-A complex member 2-like n=1 Tax=Prorops nasuta TaxID=863751 RepID=UPI0034CEF4D1
MLNHHNSALKGVDNFIRPLLKQVLQEERIGISRDSIELRSVTSSCGKLKGDRLKLSIPYAGQKLVWQVLFDSQSQTSSPDFIFDDETFLPNPTNEMILNEVKSLFFWNPTDENSLFKVLIELLLCYKRYQIQLLEQKAELPVEYTTLIDKAKICEEDVEVIILPIGGKPMEVKFVIRIAMDFSQLPIYDNNADSNAVMLIVTYYGPEWDRIVPQLYLSKTLEEVLGGSNSLHIPPFPPNKYLMNYVPEIKKYLNEKINNVVSTYEKKKNFVAAFIALQRGSIIEYDALKFSQIVVLLEYRDFHFLVYCHLPVGFPKDKPIITLQSIYHMCAQGKLYSYSCDDFPYSPRWEPFLMVTKLLTCIMKNVAPEFKTNSIKVGKSFLMEKV